MLHDLELVYEYGVLAHYLFIALSVQGVYLQVRRNMQLLIC